MFKSILSQTSTCIGKMAVKIIAEKHSMRFYINISDSLICQKIFDYRMRMFEEYGSSVIH